MSLNQESARLLFAKAIEKLFNETDFMHIFQTDLLNKLFALFTDASKSALLDWSYFFCTRMLLKYDQITLSNIWV